MIMACPRSLTQWPNYLWWLLSCLHFLACCARSESAPHQEQIVLNKPSSSNWHEDGLPSRWNFNYSSQAPHLFASAQGLLQQLPNTFFPNGHSIVPCEVPAFTNLYHGRMDAELAPSPEWFAFDIEMAFGIMGASRDSNMLTYQTTRRVGCLYFDGESATLMGRGQLDSQMLLIYGNTTGNPPDRRGRFLWDEYDRANKLCEWAQEKGVGGLGWGIEGIVRMNAGFEMIWCNFSSPSIRLLSHLNLTAPLLPHAPEDATISANGKEKSQSSTIPYYPLPTRTTTSDSGHPTDPTVPREPPNWRSRNREPFLERAAWGWFESATWHYGSSGIGSGSGEYRVKPLLCGLMSFYSPLYQSQQLARVENERRSLNLTAEGTWRGFGEDGNRTFALRELTRRRRSHTLANITRDDAHAMNTASQRVLQNLGFNQKQDRMARNCTGVDWSDVTRDIVQRHDLRLRELAVILSNATVFQTSNSTVLHDWFRTLRPRTYSLLFPYFEYPGTLYDDVDAVEDPWSMSSSNAQLTFSRCRSHYTRLLAPDQDITLNPEESDLRWAVEETLGGICKMLVEVGFAVERAWLQWFNSRPENDTLLPDFDALRKEIRHWRNGVEELMAWLGWAGQWTECQPSCSWDEICYVPMWPLNFVPGRRPQRPGKQYPYPYRGKYTDRPRPPSWFSDDDRVWEPKCVKLGEL